MYAIMYVYAIHSIHLCNVIDLDLHANKHPYL